MENFRDIKKFIFVKLDEENQKKLGVDQLVAYNLENSYYELFSDCILKSGVISNENENINYFYFGNMESNNFISVQPEFVYNYYNQKVLFNKRNTSNIKDLVKFKNYLNNITKERKILISNYLRNIEMTIEEEKQK